MSVSAKCKDQCWVILDEEGYVPFNLNIGSSDYIDFEICVNCGFMFGTWPLPEKVLEK